ncbi:MAG: PEGA domain-containing protein [Chitinivibrionales bacterium]|nr:PEGA domain-containing protein [Chitinivibrionales bacterium]
MNIMTIEGTINKIISPAIFLLAFCAIAVMAQSSKRVLFLESASVGASEYDRNILTDKIRDALSGSGLIVIQKAEMYSVLGMARINQLEKCADIPCKIRVAAPLNAEVIILGTITQKDTGYEIALRSVNAQSQKEEGAVTVFQEGALQTVAESAPQKAISDLLQNIAAQVKYLSVTAFPDTARILANGVLIGNGSIEKKKFPVSQQIALRIEAAEHEPFDTIITAIPNGEIKIFRALSYIYSSVKINSEPSGATVVLNNNTAGQTPVLATGIKPGSYQLSIVKPTYKPILIPVVLEKNKVFEHSFVLNSPMEWFCQASKLIA